MKTLSFTMEDALIAPEGIAILTGADLIEAADNKKIYVHKNLEMKAEDAGITIKDGKVSATKGLTLKDADGNAVTPYVSAVYPLFMFIKDENGYIISEPFSTATETDGAGRINRKADESTEEETNELAESNVIKESNVIPELSTTVTEKTFTGTVFFDFYTEETSGVKQIDIGYDKFAGNFYIEGSTLWKDQATGRDDAAEIIIPNGKIQTNFTFTMAGTGDPSSFTFTVDALRGRVKGGTTDCLAAIQIVEGSADKVDVRPATHHEAKK